LRFDTGVTRVAILRLARGVPDARESVIASGGPFLMKTDANAHPPLVHTYSIVARDPETGQLGAAVQSHWFAVGAGVIWAEPEVGAVATQAMALPDYGPLGLALMRSGRPAPDALRGLLATDANREVRQVAMVDATGRIAVHTGNSTIPEAGHETGEQFSVQANMMLRSTVWSAMARAYRDAKGDLADRMMSALDAAEAERGDIRGMQSAAMVVVAAKNSGRPWDKLLDVRVDDTPRPLDELRRLIQVARAYRTRGLAEASFARGDIDAGNRQYATAEELIGGNPEMKFWHAVALFKVGRIDDGIAKLREAAVGGRNWIELALRLPAAILAADPYLHARIRAATSS
jgi:uncharacterized Ntn-hydrolase superfamily protein